MENKNFTLHKQIQQANKLIDKIFSKLNFRVPSSELTIIKKRVYKEYRISPTPLNIKKHLIKMILTPIEDVPEPERKIILRAGKFDFN